VPTPQLKNWTIKNIWGEIYASVLRKKEKVALVEAVLVVRVTGDILPEIRITIRDDRIRPATIIVRRIEIAAAVEAAAAAEADVIIAAKSDIFRGSVRIAEAAVEVAEAVEEVGVIEEPPPPEEAAAAVEVAAAAAIVIIAEKRDIFRGIVPIAEAVAVEVAAEDETGAAEVESAAVEEAAVAVAETRVITADNRDIFRENVRKDQEEITAEDFRFPGKEWL